MAEISRRKHGCDCCHECDYIPKYKGKEPIKNGMPTEMFLGYCGDVLWLCHKCYEKMTAGIPRFHRKHLNTFERIYKKRYVKRKVK